MIRSLEIDTIRFSLPANQDSLVRMSADFSRRVRACLSSERNFLSTFFRPEYNARMDGVYKELHKYIDAQMITIFPIDNNI
ncbi:hypothetical protein [Pelosinus fermentans]|uniref:hypothetical protein n=1 Tax=Pelosinus fermentans TaxID=365349 RepID=UPI001186D3D7|nr:hypothetical protein [Pelosinus fermentans]